MERHQLFARVALSIQFSLAWKLKILVIETKRKAVGVFALLYHFRSHLFRSLIKQQAEERLQWRKLFDAIVRAYD